VKKYIGFNDFMRDYMLYNGKEIISGEFELNDIRWTFELINESMYYWTCGKSYKAKIIPILELI
jgi:hypothetical protein